MVKFIDEFKYYVLSLDLSDGREINFGNHEYDYSIKLIGKRYILEIFDVELDHYGMPYRNTLSSTKFDISYLFN